MFKMMDMLSELLQEILVFMVKAHLVRYVCTKYVLLCNNMWYFAILISFWSFKVQSKKSDQENV